MISDYYNDWHKGLELKNDLEWFDSFCEVLKKERKIKTKELAQLIGSEKPNPNNEIRGSRFLIPFDKRFKSASINPILSENEGDRPLDYLSFYGEKFQLKMSDIIKRFADYRVQINIYDDGSQIFFYPVPKEYEFSAIAFKIEEEPDAIKNIDDLIFNSVSFHFGDKLSLQRDGYCMQR
jgi:hypothetical protein